jgi:hypothetical protein
MKISACMEEKNSRKSKILFMVLIQSNSESGLQLKKIGKKRIWSKERRQLRQKEVFREHGILHNMIIKM